MGSRVWAVTILVVLVSAGAGGYGYFAGWFSERPVHVEPPKFETPAGPLPEAERFAELARTDPIGMLEAGLAKYTANVQGFRSLLEKQERIDGHPTGKDPEVEIIHVAVRNQPLAVVMKWERGMKLGVGATLYVEGVTGDQIKTRGAAGSLMPDWSIDVKGMMARRSARYTITEIGFDQAMLRTLDAWKKVKERGELKIDYLGLTNVAKAGGRACHVVRRTCPTTEADSFALDEARPTDPAKLRKDGFDTVTIMIDAETWLQVGTELRKANGELIGAYYFRDVELNPTFAPDTFTPAALKKN